MARKLKLCKWSPGRGFLGATKRSSTHARDLAATNRTVVGQHKNSRAQLTLELSQMKNPDCLPHPSDYNNRSLVWRKKLGLLKCYYCCFANFVITSSTRGETRAAAWFSIFDRLGFLKVEISSYLGIAFKWSAIKESVVPLFNRSRKVVLFSDINLLGTSSCWNSKL